MNKQELAKQLILTENNLNIVRYNNIPIGGLLSLYHNQFCFNELKEPSLLKSIVSLLNMLRSIFKRITYPDFKEKPIVFTRVGDTKHLKKLIDPVYQKLSNQSILLTSKGSLNNIKFQRALRMNMILPIIKFLLFKYWRVKEEYNKRGVKVSWHSLLVFLTIQLISVDNWKQVLQNSKLKLAIVDFDRHELNAALILVANSLKIKTVTLVHGVINPPFGYYPLLANEIWVWGNYQKGQMIDFGLNEARIRVVGNPIAEKITKVKKVNKQLTIGIALNPIKDAINIKALKHILSSHAKKFNYQWIIKLHPSMQKTEEYLSFSSDRISVIDSHDLSNKLFFQKIDILILGNSGIGMEALLNDIPLLVYRLSKHQRGHDSVMIDEGNCPEINNLAVYLEILKNIESERFRKGIMEDQKRFLEKYYFKMGTDASNEIVKTIINVL